MENLGFRMLFRPAAIQSTMELGQIFFFSGGDFDLSCPNQVWYKKYLNRRTGDNPAKTSSQKVNIPPNRKILFYLFLRKLQLFPQLSKGKYFSII